MSHLLLMTAQSNFLLMFNSPLLMDLQVMLIVLVSIHTSSFSITAAPDDYEPLDVTLMFDECETRRCVNVSIVDDFVDEPDKNFLYSLERTPDLHPRIDLDPTLGEMEIVDNDG